MQEYNSGSAVQDYGSLPTETSVPAEASVSMDGASRLLRLSDLARELGAEPVAEEARELAARVSEGRFYVATVSSEGMR